MLASLAHFIWNKINSHQFIGWLGVSGNKKCDAPHTYIIHPTIVCSKLHMLWFHVVIIFVHDPGEYIHTCIWLKFVHVWFKIIELDWLGGYQMINPFRLCDVIQGKGWIQKWSPFQLDSLFSPHPCTQSMGKKRHGSLHDVYESLWSDNRDSLIYWSSAVLSQYCLASSYSMIAIGWYIFKDGDSNDLSN